jgi:hypothetical protein
MNAARTPYRPKPSLSDQHVAYTLLQVSAYLICNTLGTELLQESGWKSLSNSNHYCVDKPRVPTRNHGWNGARWKHSFAPMSSEQTKAHTSLPLKQPLGPGSQEHGHTTYLWYTQCYTSQDHGSKLLQTDPLFRRHCFQVEKSLQ